jgi:CysZ protein
VIIAVLLTVPILNLIAPVIATSFMLHLFEAMRRRPALRA